MPNTPPSGLTKRAQNDVRLQAIAMVARSLTRAGETLNRIPPILGSSDDRPVSYRFDNFA
jgi:hypothetical protein